MLMKNNGQYFAFLRNSQENSLSSLDIRLDKRASKGEEMVSP